MMGVTRSYSLYMQLLETSSQNHHQLIRRTILTTLWHNQGKTQLSDDSKALSFYGLTSGTRLWLLVTPEPKPFDVFLKNEKGQTSVYQVTLEETVTQFKARVCEKLKVPVDQQRLIHNGKQLDDGRMLAEYDIKAGSVIYLTLRLRGG